MFSGLRENSIVYLLDKSGECPKLYEGTVVKKLNPNNGYIPTPFGMPETEVSYSVQVGDAVHNLERLPANQNIVDYKGMVVSDNREAMLAEVQAMQRASIAVLDTVPYHTAVKEACEDMYSVLNPQIAKDKENERKIGVLEEKIGGMEGTLTNIQAMLSEALSKSSTRKTQQS